jgi:hypothetical protein
MKNTKKNVLTGSLIAVAIIGAVLLGTNSSSLFSSNLDSNSSFSATLVDNNISESNAKYTLALKCGVGGE